MNSMNEDRSLLNIKVKNRPELLAPAGDFQSFLGAVNAGADAVYLAGDRYGARAYAHNLSKEELLDALTYAHVHGRKIYLTVNTLTRNPEGKELFDYIKPFYLAGLDGVIVQDFGVFAYLHRVFPDLAIHVSTQMCVTSAEGALYLKNLGAKRIVPARELCLKEIEAIHEVGVETECFIHGSMCYSYSGQCLFSSFLGGRSGNRGRCAGPCRQPYTLNKLTDKDLYLLSLKDLCTLEMLPKLIDAGISSFKIEGRMKSPAFAAGVTEIYRKYIDSYLSNPTASYQVEAEDLNRLKSLYLRTDLQRGYYEKNHGKEMVSIHSPSYNKTDDALSAGITNRYCRKKEPVPYPVNAVFQIGEPAAITALPETAESFCPTWKSNENEYSDSIGPNNKRKENGDSDSTGFNRNVTENNNDSQGKLMTEVTGPLVEAAKNSPITKEDLAKRLGKSAEGLFSLQLNEVSLSDNAFLSVGELNALRRAMEEKLKDACNSRYASRQIHEGDAAIFGKISSDCSEMTTGLRIFVTERPQFTEILNYFESVGMHDIPHAICFPVDYLEDEETVRMIRTSKESFFAVLPPVLRMDNLPALNRNIKTAEELTPVRGFYAGQVDSVAYLKKHTTKEIHGDLSFYIANNESVSLFDNEITNYTISTELSKDEILHLAHERGELMIYGRIPLMQTANCVLNTTGNCRKKEGFVNLKDRKKAVFPIYTHCREKVCYNTIYNSVPFSLHRHFKSISRMKIRALQIRFTDERAKVCTEIIHLYEECLRGERIDNVPFEYTNGHFTEGVL